MKLGCSDARGCLFVNQERHVGRNVARDISGSGFIPVAIHVRSIMMHDMWEIGCYHSTSRVPIDKQHTGLEKHLPTSKDGRTGLSRTRAMTLPIED